MPKFTQFKIGTTPFSSQREEKSEKKGIKMRVVHCQKEDYDVYIGRAVPRSRLKKSPFANPFKISKTLSREESIREYKGWLLAQPELVEKARKELKGKVLGCWCKPEACHGDVLVEIVEGNEPE
jgi:hypothetical protein